MRIRSSDYLCSPSCLPPCHNPQGHAAAEPQPCISNVVPNSSPEHQQGCETCPSPKSVTQGMFWSLAATALLPAAADQVPHISKSCINAFGLQCRLQALPLTSAARSSTMSCLPLPYHPSWASFFPPVLIPSPSSYHLKYHWTHCFCPSLVCPSFLFLPSSNLPNFMPWKSLS